MLHHAGMLILFLIHSIQLMNIFNEPRVLFVFQTYLTYVCFFHIYGIYACIYSPTKVALLMLFEMMSCTLQLQRMTLYAYRGQTYYDTMMQPFMAQLLFPVSIS